MDAIDGALCCGPKTQCEILSSGLSPDSNNVIRSPLSTQSTREDAPFILQPPHIHVRLFPCRWTSGFQVPVTNHRLANIVRQPYLS